MKQFTLMLAIMSITVLVGCTHNPNTTMSTADETVTANAALNIDQEINAQETDIAMEQESQAQPTDAMIKQDNSVEQIIPTNITTTEGSYQDYNASAVQSALSAGKSVVLFFHAGRCPSCRNLEAEINANTLPDNTIVFKVDYDNSTDLKKQYGVTTQHTLVRIDTDLSMIEKNIGGTFTDLVNLF